MVQNSVPKGLDLVGLVTICMFICSIDAQIDVLPPSLPWFTYKGVVDDLGQHLRDGVHVPPGHRNIILFARQVTLRSNLNFNLSNYRDMHSVELTVVCETLEVVSGTCTIDFSCKDAPHMISFNDKKGSPAMAGKGGCQGGSISLFAKNKIGTGDLIIDTCGGNGGMGQAGYIGAPGDRGDDGYFTGYDGEDGEDGGDGGDGGRGGNAGHIGIAVRDDNPSSFIEQTHTSGGAGGDGGNGGEGGSGGPGGWGLFWNGNKGDAGSDGADGSTGSNGDSTEHQLQQISSDVAFRQMLPITGDFLQRALNDELFRIALAKIEDDASMKSEIRSNLDWIDAVALDNGYTLVRQRCSELSALIDQDVQLPSGSVEIETQKIRDYFDDVEQVVQEVMDVDPSNLIQTIKKNPVLRKFSSHARELNNLGEQYKKLKSRLQKADGIANEVSDVGPISNAAREFITTSFRERVSNVIRTCAMKRPYLAAALDNRGKRNIEPTSSLKAAQLLRLGSSAAVAVPVAIVGAYVLYETYSFIQANLEDYYEELEKYENEVRAGIKRLADNLKKLEIDKYLPAPPFPRFPYLRPRWPLPPGDVPERPPVPVPVLTSTRFIGVLTKCEPVESTGSEKVVATFDAIPLLFTVPSETGSVDINDLDSIQKGELFSQLEAYNNPFSILPSFMLTTVQTRGIVNEDAVGRWFEFNVVFEYGGNSEASAIIPTVTLELGQINQTISGLAKANIPITIVSDSIEALSSSKQNEITTELGLTSVTTSSSKKRSTRQVWPNWGSLSNNFLRVTNQIKLRAKHPLVNTYRVDSALVANVGQGNFNILYQGNTMKVVFDMGFGYESMQMSDDQRNALITQIENDSPIMVVSHWDRDHFDLLRIYPQLTQGKIFIVPSHGSDWGMNVRRIYDDIPIWNRISYSPGQRSIVTNLGNVNLRMTTKPNGNNDKNNYGALTACVMDNQGRPLFLMPGDASYNYVNNDFTNGLRLLVATHHGSTNDIGAIPVAQNYQGTAYFSYGFQNQHGHSLQNAWRSYNNAGWINRRKTEGSGRGIGVSFVPFLING